MRRYLFFSAMLVFVLAAAGCSVAVRGDYDDGHPGRSNPPGRALGHEKHDRDGVELEVQLGEDEHPGRSKGRGPQKGVLDRSTGFDDVTGRGVMHVRRDKYER